MSDDSAALPWAAEPDRGGEKVAPAFAEHRFTFTGEWKEYFGIWIVNVLLTILTLGIYSAWAKVRRQRWFYGHTHIAGSAFEYHASPVRILIGRIIVLALIGIYNLALNFVPLVGIAIGVLFLFAVPWFLARGLRFNARVTSWRNRRFDFTGTYWKAWPGFILWPMAAYTTSGILAPFASRSSWSYVINNMRFAGRPMATDPDLGKLFRQLGPALLVILAGVIAAIGLAAMIAVGWGGWLGEFFARFDPANEDSKRMAILVAAAAYFILIPFFLVFALASLVYRAGVRNVVFSSTVIDGRHMLDSRVSRRRYLAIAVTNFLATVFTLGLMRPWAAVRMAKYMAASTSLIAAGSLDDFVAGEADPGAAAAAEYLDVEGFDFGF